MPTMKERRIITKTIISLFLIFIIKSFQYLYNISILKACGGIAYNIFSIYEVVRKRNLGRAGVSCGKTAYIALNTIFAF